MELPELIKYIAAFFFLYSTVFFFLLALKNRDEFPKKTKPTNWRPKISVIIPAYNEGSRILACLESVFRIDYPKDKLEIIVIDDGSTDDTFEVLKKLGSKIKAFRKENGGKAAALNFGLKQASGEIIATLDADSYVTKDAIIKMLPLFDSDDVAAVTAAVKVKPKRGEGLLRTMQKLEYLFIIFARKILTYVDAVPVTPGPLSMFRSWVFKRLGPFDEKNIMEDQEIALRIQSANYRIRSSMEADVYTEVPENFFDLLNQRVRWHRGGLRNNFKYMHMISPVYGDFGLMMMPMTFIAVFILLSLFLVGLIEYLSSVYYGAAPGFENFLLTIRPIHIIGAIIAFINILWILWGVFLFKKERISGFKLAIYMFAYLYLITIYWVVALFREFTLQKVTWKG